MINILIYLAIVLCLAFIACGAAFLNYEVSKEKEEAKQTNTNLQIELDNNQIWKIWKLLVWLLILLWLLKA